MDTFDADNIPAQEPGAVPPEQPREPVSQDPPQADFQNQQPSQPYQGAGTGRRESPYANSPYMTGQQPPQYQYQPYQYQPPQKPPKPKKERSSGGVGRKILAVALVCALVAGGCLITAGQVSSRWRVAMEEQDLYFNQKIGALQKQLDGLPAGGSGTVVPAGEGMTPGELYRSCVDSVVAISSTVQSTGYYGTTTGRSTGSGFILSEDGYIVTNFHVVEDATAITVVLHDGTEYPAALVGRDASNDVAVLKAQAQGLSPVQIGSSGDLVIGDMVAAIGNPLGKLAATQTVGYVSGMGREVTTDKTIISMIQTDAAINPGNSGGPLFNMNGEVIGITTAKYSGTTGSGATIEGIGFAIPIDDIKGILEDLVDFGYVTGAYLGVTVENIDAAMISKYGLPTGAYVRTLEPEGAAQKAGIQVKDIIVDLGGITITSITDLTRTLRNFRAGDTTTVTVVRGGQRMTLEVTLDEMPKSSSEPTPTAPSAPAAPSDEDMLDAFRRFFGS